MRINRRVTKEDVEAKKETGRHLKIIQKLKGGVKENGKANLKNRYSKRPN